MKKHLLIIITSILLTNSCLQSADKISDNLPSFLRVDSKWRNQVKEIQEKTGTSTPIIFVNTDGTYAWNSGFGPFRFAIMSINQAQFQENSPDFNIQALAHETVHIDQNHGGLSTLTCAGIGMIGLSLILKSIQPQLSSFISFDAKTSSSLADLTEITGLTCVTIATLTRTLFSNTEQLEHEAEEGSLKKLSQLGRCDTLENLSKYYKAESQNHANYRALRQLASPSSGIFNYPSYKQMHEWAERECRECRQNEMNSNQKGFE